MILALRRTFSVPNASESGVREVGRSKECVNKEGDVPLGR